MICKLCNKDIGEKRGTFVEHRCHIEYLPNFINNYVPAHYNLTTFVAQAIPEYNSNIYGLMQHRLSGNGVDYYDDHTSTNPQTFYNRYYVSDIISPILCIGGSGKMDVINVTRMLGMLRPKAIVLFGENGMKLESHGTYREDAQKAALECRSQAVSGDTVVFTPLAEVKNESETFFGVLRYFF